MTRFDQIRQAITTAGRALSCAEIRAVVPGHSTPSAITAMVKDGYLRRSGMPQSYVYAVGRQPAPRVYGRTPEERRALKNARDRARYASLSREQRRELEARRKRRTVKPKPRRVVPAKPAPAPALAVDRESVAAWMARTGKTPEVLPGFTSTLPPRRPVALPRGYVA